MTDLENKFFEEFIRLEKLCNEIYDTKNGVSSYIEDMEENAAAGRGINGWQEDYKALKHVRYVRNQIAHELDEAYTAEKSDVDYVKSFYRRIMNEDDPLSRLATYRREQKQARQREKVREQKAGIRADQREQRLIRHAEHIDEIEEKGRKAAPKILDILTVVFIAVIALLIVMLVAKGVFGF